MFQGDVTFVSQLNQGLSEARNTGLRYARGEYIAFCDSDDWLNEKTIIEAMALAKSSQADIVLFRSCVYDSHHKTCHPFYDDGTWDCIMRGHFSKTVNISSDPQLLCLEPNTNNRLINREFFHRHIKEFPPGIYFEDVKPHVISLACANKIALLDSVGYFYRVNRPGKITDQKSERRFDILKTAEDVLKHEIIMHLSAYQKYCVLTLLIKMIYWCGCNTLLKDRQRFFFHAIKLFSKKNAENYKILHQSLRFAGTNRQFILMASLLAGATKFIADCSKGNKGMMAGVRMMLALAKVMPLCHRLIILRALSFTKHRVLHRVRGH